MGVSVRGLGESALNVDSRGGQHLSLTVRVGSYSGFETHAIATSDGGGATWDPAQLVPARGSAWMATPSVAPSAAAAEDKEEGAGS